MPTKSERDHKKDIILICCSMIIGIFCMGIVAWLQYQSFVLGKPLPEYSLAFFGSIAGYVFGYTFGRRGS